MKKKFSRAVKESPFQPEETSVYIRYGKELELRMLVPESVDGRAAGILRPVRNKAIENISDLLRRVRLLEKLGHEVTFSPDAEDRPLL